MKLYKRDIQNFIEEKRAETLQALAKNYTDVINASKLVRAHECIDGVKKYIDPLHKLEESLRELELANKEYLTKYNDILTSISSINNAISFLNQFGLSDIVLNSEEKELERDYKNKRNDIQCEYNKLLAFSKNNTAKTTYELLKNLGYDVSTIVPTTPTYVVSTNQFDVSNLIIIKKEG